MCFTNLPLLPLLLFRCKSLGNCSSWAGGIKFLYLYNVPTWAWDFEPFDSPSFLEFSLYISEKVDLIWFFSKLWHSIDYSAEKLDLPIFCISKAFWSLFLFFMNLWGCWGGFWIFSETTDENWFWNLCWFSLFLALLCPSDSNGFCWECFFSYRLKFRNMLSDLLLESDMQLEALFTNNFELFLLSIS